MPLFDRTGETKAGRETVGMTIVKLIPAKSKISDHWFGLCQPRTIPKSQVLT